MSETLIRGSERRIRAREVVSRVLAAIFGGYAAASALSMVLARVIPLSRAGATTAASLATVPLYALAVLWVFAARTAMRAWIGLALVGGGAGLLAWALISLGGRS